MMRHSSDRWRRQSMKCHIGYIQYHNLKNRWNAVAESLSAVMDYVKKIYIVNLMHITIQVTASGVAAYMDFVFVLGIF